MQSVVRTAVRGARGAAREQRRCLASQPALDVEMPGMPALSPGSAHGKPVTQVTTLENGLRVASEDNYGQAVSMGVFVDAGSRYETAANSGVSHMLEHMAFKKTSKRSTLRVVRDVEEIGGAMVASSAREFMIYQGECLREHVDAAVEIVADTLQNSAMTPWDMDQERKTIGYELEDMEANPQSMVTELLHAAAYTEESPLGRSIWCPQRNLNKLTPEDLHSFMGTHFTAPRMVLSAAGVEHDRLVDLAKEHFGGLRTAPEGGEPQTAKAEYIGGDRRLHAESPLTHVSLCFDAAGWMADDMLETCTLHMLLGGGGSFSAGGPGKGMYSRLYTNVLNKHHWVDSATATNQMYNDGGLIGIYGTCLPGDAGRLVDVMSAELEAVAAAPPSQEETERAKNQLKSSILMKLESRAVLFEDIGRQLLTWGKRESGKELCDRIDKVTPEGIQKCMKRALASKATLASFGDVSSVPRYDIVASRFN